ncbi:UPF0262 family protein [Breoghania sp.]|uniref:UPF0262 family protein n=1 Tax=Breoghania sp. TaxID=2065378 RepID=UPI002AA5F577|nr:UPF0262 family protein [Breoghania sp.]
METEQSEKARITKVTLDESSIERSSADIEHERAVAIFDLLADNYFQPIGDDVGGPYHLNIAVIEKRLHLTITRENGDDVVLHVLALGPLRKILKDYFLICETYYAAIRTATPSQIEAIDMGRRGVHNEASDLLAERLKGKISVDHTTARRLFTLICALYKKG